MTKKTLFTPDLRDYDAYIHRKVAAGRQQMGPARGRSDAEVEAQFAERRAGLSRAAMGVPRKGSPDAGD